MDSSDAVWPAVAEAVGFLAYFQDLADPRQQGKVTYPLEEILLLCLMATLAGAEHITEIALFGDKKIGLLRRLRPFADGTPRHDHLGDIRATLDAEPFQQCFAAWPAPACPKASSPLTARPRAGPAARARRRGIWSRPSPLASA
jgi:DDE_Tnp_1-associated